MTDATLDPDGWIKRIAESDLDEKANAKERRRQERGEMSRLSKYMNKGAQLVAERVEGVGIVYRTRARTSAPFSAATVEKWCAREGKAIPRDDQ